MDVARLLLGCGLSFVFLCIVFRPLELAFPARAGQRFLRSAWFTDLGFFAGQYLLWNGVVFSLLAATGHWLDGVVPVELSDLGRVAELVAPGDRSRAPERSLRLLGASPAASRRMVVAVSLHPSQCRASGLAGRASRASYRYFLHVDADQLAGVCVGFPVGDVGRPDRLSRHLGDLHSFQRATATWPVANADRGAGATPLAPRPRPRPGFRQLRQHLAAHGRAVRHLSLSGPRTGKFWRLGSDAAGLPGSTGPSVPRAEAANEFRTGTAIKPSFYEPPA